MRLLEVMGWLDMVELVGYLTLPIFLLIDLFWHDRMFQTPKFWRGRAALVTLANFYIAGYTAMFWSKVLGGFHLFNGTGWGVVGGAAVGVLVYELIHYWYHRLAHQWQPLWRLTHQMHHAPEAVDAYSAFYIHPFDNMAFTTFGSLVFFPLLGVSPEAGLLGSVFLTFNAVFQHANIRTPRWLGYLIQRPESHRVHHQRGRARANYADLPLWDMVFGTFKNPAHSEVKESPAGFYEGASNRILEMLFFRDVTSPKTAAPRRKELAEAA